MLPRLSVGKIGSYERTDAVDAIDLELRNLTYAKVVELGRVPAVAEVAAAAGRDPEEVVAGWRRLHDEHALVLNPATATPPPPPGASRSRSRCAAGDATTRACSSTASSPPPAGGTTSSSPEAR